jgi:hypothetical protein
VRHSHKQAAGNQRKGGKGEHFGDDFAGGERNARHELSDALGDEHHADADVDHKHDECEHAA